MITIIIPTFNEAPNIKKLIYNIKKSLKKYKYEIILVDKNSPDNTVKIAKKLNIKVLSANLNKGAAILLGISNSRGNIIIMMDGDQSHKTEELPLFINEIKKGYDICFGSRFISGGGSSDITLIRKFINDGFVWLCNYFYKSHYTDITYGYIAFNKKCIGKLNLLEEGFGIETEIHIKAIKYNLKIKEIPSVENKRIYGISKVTIFNAPFSILKALILNL